jgi:hypothetical protein
VDDIKPGFQTTEFWLTLLATVISAVMATNVIPDSSVVGRVLVIVAAILATLGYTVSRSIVKASGRRRGVVG